MIESGLKAIIINVKVDVEKFDGWNNFDLWQSDMMEALIVREHSQNKKWGKKRER